MERRVAAVVVLAAALLGAAGQTADAATVEVKTLERLRGVGDKGTYTEYEYAIVYAAAPGELNVPRVSLTPDGVVVGDRGARLTPGAMCAAAGDEVVCRPPAAPTEFEVALGDGADALERGAVPTDAGARATVDGGTGDDRIELGPGSAVGGEGDDRITGDAGNQSFEGGPGADDLEGGEGNDVLDGGPGPDRLFGGPGIDVVAWTGETDPVFVDLAIDGPAGTMAQRDIVVGAESASGGAGNDVLRGTGGINELRGGPGNDRLEGLGANDALYGDAGDDTITGGAGDDFMDGDTEYRTFAGTDALDGGPGRDSVSSGYGADVVRGGDGSDRIEAAPEARRIEGGAGADLVSVLGRGSPRSDGVWRRLSLACGAGRDRVEWLQPPAVHPRDCELAVLSPPGGLAVSTRLRRAGGRLLVPAPFDCTAEPLPCPLRIEVRSASGVKLAGRRVGRGRSGRSTAFRIGPRLHQALRRPSLEIRYRFGSTVTRRVPVRPPRR